MKLRNGEGIAYKPAVPGFYNPDKLFVIKEYGNAY
jgi:hypothetical protein